VPITCGFRDCKRSLSAVIFGYLDGFCDHKVSKRSTAQRDQRPITCTLGVVGNPVDSEPDHTPTREAALDATGMCAIRLCPRIGVW
jgi:hypothetical protein